MIGLLLKDRYQVEKELGRGGFGVVYLARDQQLLGKPVVIKVLTDDLAADPWPLKKFRQEIEAMARIDHPGVVGALDTGETSEGKPFLVMQFVEGVNLRGEIPAEGMDIARAANLIRQIGQALNAAHAAGVWHRDLKPENIMLQKPGDSEEYVKLIDFGIAAIKDSRFAEAANTTKVAGSYAYMSPEQFAGNPSAQSDIWAFGVITYEMLTGKKPFNSDSLFQLMMDQQQGVPVRPRQLRPAIPHLAEDVILRALTASLDQRYQRPREFGDALAKALTEEPRNDGTAEVIIPSPDATTAYATPSQRIDPKKVEMAHILFMDIVGFSKEYMDQGAEHVKELQQIVRQSPAYQTAERNREILRLATGDGMALVFFGDPTTAAQCALEVGAALKSRPHLPMRMGINTGPVQRIEDINAGPNVSGAGINMAQRVMDAGDAGHILCSKSTAEVLTQLKNWAPHLHDLGECEVKHGIKIPIYNLYTPEIGSSEWPSRIPRRREDVERESLKGQSRRALIGAAAALVLVVGGLGVWRSLKPAAPETAFEYWATAQKIADKSITRQVQERILDDGYQIAIHMKSPAPGYLYILNKGKLAPNAPPVFVVLYPGPNADSAVAAGAEIRTPASTEHWFKVDKTAGDEFLYLVWATGKVDELERIKDSESDPESNHVIIKETEPGFKSLDDFMAKYMVDPKTQIERNEDAKTSVVRGRSSILVHLVRLAHM